MRGEKGRTDIAEANEKNIDLPASGGGFCSGHCSCVLGSEIYRSIEECAQYANEGLMIDQVDGGGDSVQNLYR